MKVIVAMLFLFPLCVPLFHVSSCQVPVNLGRSSICSTYMFTLMPMLLLIQLSKRFVVLIQVSTEHNAKPFWKKKNTAVSACFTVLYLGLCTAY